MHFFRRDFKTSTWPDSALRAFSRGGSPASSVAVRFVSLAACTGGQSGPACLSVLHALSLADGQVTRCLLVGSRVLPVGLPCPSSCSWTGHMVSPTKMLQNGV